MLQMKSYNQSTALVSINLSAAFDLVDHDILVNRLGARLYTLYVRPLSDIFNRHDVHYHSYAYDTQLYVHFECSYADSMREALLKLENCIKEISHWMTHNGLKLNEDKTEWIIINGCDISKM